MIRRQYVSETLPVDCDLHVHFSSHFLLEQIGSSGLPCDLTSLMDLKALVFQSVYLFTCC